jgi:hypothetical protein
MNKKTAEQILLEKKDTWKILEKGCTGFKVECQKCGLVQGLSKYMVLKGNDECCCSSKKMLSTAKKQAQAIYSYMTSDIKGYGLLEGEELSEYVKDIIRIDNYLLSLNTVFIDAVVDEMYKLYEKKEVQRCAHCKKLYPASRMYQNICLKKYKAYCVA